jgi:RNA polymerase sigma-70 factor (ECF subfamily)
MLVAAPLTKLEDAHPGTELGVEVLLACQRGERAALTRFVQAYERRIFAYLARALGCGFVIEDLAQEVFVRAYQALPRFDVNGNARLSTWLLTIAHRVGVDARRRRRPACAELETERYPSQVPSPEQLLGREELRLAIARAVSTLPPEQREVFVLAEFHDLSTSEIARVVGAMESTVKTRLFRAKARLRLALGPLVTESP